MQKLRSFSLRSLIEHQALFSTSVSSSSPDFLPSYLATKCGFSSDKAFEASKLLRRVKSPDQPDSVIAFFKSLGFNDCHVSKLIQTKPRLLAQGVEKSFAPRVRMLNDIGIVGGNLVNLIISNPNVLDANIEHNFKPQFELWTRVVGSDELLMKCLKDGRWMFGYNLKKLDNNVSFLQECGLTDHQISLIVTKQPCIITQKLESLNGLVSRVERLGVTRGSPSFHWAIRTLSMVSAANLRAKVELFKGFGWSQEDFAKAFRKAPAFLTISPKVLKEKMEILMKEASCSASYIALQPFLLTLSLKKRLVPRLKVVKALKEKRFVDGNPKLPTLMSFTNKKFYERYVDPYKETSPELIQYFSARS